MKKILICDDSLAEMKLMQSLLQSAGYWPVAVSDSRQIEQSIAAERPQLILLDVVMPDRNGYQVCRDLKGNAEFNRIPVIIVSSKDQESDKFWAQQQGADGYVIKPFTAVQLLDAVRKFV
ncbi:MAG: response regulator [Terriglobales bacterium]